MKPALFLICSALLAAPARAVEPASPAMLAGAWLPEDSHRLDFDKLPRVPSLHAVVSDVRAKGSSPTSLDKQKGGVNQHNYLAHHSGKFWAMWSDGPGIEDRVGQRVKFATSADGLKWSTPRFLTPVPPQSGPDSPHYGTRTDKGSRYISRGFWKRDGELLALASLDEAAGFFGESLELRAFRLKAADESWEDAGVVFKNAINNFPPLKLRTGDWMMSRRTHDYKATGVHFLVGGVKSLGDWQSFPVLGSASELKAEEPDWWILPDHRLAAVFRDNRRSGHLYRSFSTDDGRTWSKPVKTNFPDATSKISGLRLRDGRYVLVSNPNPKKRDPLTLAISPDGVVFTKLLYLVGGRHVDYPHVIEHENYLFVAFAGGKQTVEVLKLKLSDVDAVRMPAQPLIARENPPPPTGARRATAGWIDLGEDGGKLYLTAELTVPRRGESAALQLAANSGLERVGISIDAAGRLGARLDRHETRGPELKAGETLSLLVRVVAHRSKPDALAIRIGPAGTIPKEADSASDWTLLNEAGETQGNLSHVILHGSREAPSFTRVRVAGTHAELATAKPVAVTFANPAP